MHSAHSASKKQLPFGSVNVLSEDNAHSDREGQGAKQVARVFVVVLQPPSRIICDLNPEQFRAWQRNI